ncbi:gem-associated protein 5 [Belonocnema kinseyi]|uniref:gem-associated protein 5 n=1 Tax=Belonocnema kinseyi TaxID=2817044 RepID=UPI00143D6E96|nr:gem-associated protein 5 [Belonocnema kinseyi]
MNEVTLPPSPNWYLSSVMSCSKNGTVAWGSRHSIVIGHPKENSKILDYSYILNAHTDRVTAVVLSPEFEKPEKRLLVSAGDEHVVKIWNVDTLATTLTNSILDAKQKVIGLDWSKCDPNLICYVSSEGFLVTWNIAFDTNQIITPAKLSATCIACCPHESNLVALGSKKGQVLIINTQGSGSVVYNLRGHDVEIVSLSWCPVSSNIIVGNGARDLLLASGGKDRSVFFWRAGGDGRYQSQIFLPPSPLDTQKHRSKLGGGSFNWTTVCWAEPKLLLMSSSFGELISWDLTKVSGKNKPVYKLIHACHNRGLFSIATYTQIEDKNEQTNWREKIARRIWTLGQDRQVICCDLLEDRATIEYRIPTQGGFVYCLAACPLDTTQIAFGAGDAMLRLWNLSEPHESLFEIATLWQKIMGKVRAMSWHPEKENLLAFGTGEGRIGVYDTNATRPPLLYRQYHRNVVYSLHWGPAPNIKLYALYSCADGELVFYNPEKSDEEPKSVIKKECTEFSWKPDYSYMAVGFEHGKISFFDRNLKELEGSIYNPLRTAVHCLVWHPESTATDLSMSPLQNYLAVAFNSAVITVFDICDLKSNPEAKENGEVVPDFSNQEAKEPAAAFYRTVATLSGHSERVVSLAWSPHQSGYLVSGSYDNTVQIWKVESQELLGTFTGHSGPVFCCMWSPLDPDFIITGSADFTVKIWKLSDHEAVMPTISKKVRTKKKKHQIEKSSKAEGEEEATAALKVKQSDSQNSIHEKKTATKKDLKKKITTFPVYNKTLNNKTAILSSVRTLLKSIKSENDPEMEEVKDNDEEKDITEEECVPSIFAGKESVLKIIDSEKTVLNSLGQYNYILEFDVWSNNLQQHLQDAVKGKRLTEYLVSLAPSLSMKTWQETCEAYAMQLLSEGHINKAVCYLLRIHRNHQAVGIFLDAKMFKEALALATLKLDPEDPVVENILRDWASTATKEGFFEEAVQCHLKLKNFTKAAQLLARRKDVHCLDLAAELAETGDDLELSDSLAEQAINESLLVSDFKIANKIIDRNPRIRYRKIQVAAFEEIKKAMENTDSKKINDWFQGKSTLGILENLKSIYKDSGFYSELAKAVSCLPPKAEAELWINVSYQISMAVISENESQFLKHILTSVGMIYNFEKSQDRAESSERFLIKFLSILDAKNPSSEESFFSKENKRAKALRAYLCYGLLNWCSEEISKKLDLENNEFMVDMIEKYIPDLLDRETVKHWTAINEISKVEASLAFSIGKSQTPEDENLDTALNVEQLDRLRFESKQFLENRVSTPNSLEAFAISLELIDQISNENLKTRLQKLIDDAWTKATN